MRVNLAFVIAYNSPCGEPLVEMGCTSIDDWRVDDFLKAFAEILQGEVIYKKRFKHYPEWHEVEPLFKKAILDYDA